jgi:hypothetical protein
MRKSLFIILSIHILKLEISGCDSTPPCVAVLVASDAAEPLS